MAEDEEETYPDENEEDVSFSNTRSHPLLERYMGRKVYDPLLGLYLAEEEYSEDDDNHEGLVTVPTASWEDNWLFKQPGTVRNINVMNAVSMLLPNATDDVKTQIGNTDFDHLVSELSEDRAKVVNEVSASESDVEMCDDEHCDDQTKNTGDSEQDHDYTIYDLVPVRKQYSSQDTLTKYKPAGLDNRPDHPYQTETNIISRHCPGDLAVGVDQDKLVKLMLMCKHLDLENFTEKCFITLGEEIGESSTDDIVQFGGGAGASSSSSSTSSSSSERSYSVTAVYTIAE